jgi:hypothetical protein
MAGRLVCDLRRRCMGRARARLPGGLTWRGCAHATGDDGADIRAQWVAWQRRRRRCVAGRVLVDGGVAPRRPVLLPQLACAAARWPRGTSARVTAFLLAQVRTGGAGRRGAGPTCGDGQRSRWTSAGESAVAAHMHADGGEHDARSAGVGRGAWCDAWRVCGRWLREVCGRRGAVGRGGPREHDSPNGLLAAVRPLFGRCAGTALVELGACTWLCSLHVGGVRGGGCAVRWRGRGGGAERRRTSQAWSMEFGVLADAHVGGVCGQQVRAWGWRGDAACTGRWCGVGVGLPPPGAACWSVAWRDGVVAPHRGVPA